LRDHSIKTLKNIRIAAGHLEVTKLFGKTLSPHPTPRSALGTTHKLGSKLAGQIILANSSLRSQRYARNHMRMAAKTSFERISGSARSCLLAIFNKASSLKQSVEQRRKILA
jgi:hypothetical protein